MAAQDVADRGALSEEARAGVISEKLCIAHVSSERIETSMPAHIHHLKDGSTLPGGRR